MRQRRGVTTAATLLLAVIAAEEMPAGSRAYAISVMTMTGALGAGVAVWALPLADLDVRAWRILYLIPLIGLPVVLHVRDAHADLAAILAAHPACRGVVHSFTGTPAEAETYLALGWHLVGDLSRHLRYAP